MNGIRRAVLRFDVAARIPVGAKIEAVMLTLHASTTNGGARVASLHRVLAEWSEGPSVSTGGQGAPSQSGDVTWLHTEFDQETWSRAGGHFIARKSDSTVVVGAGKHTWSNRHLVRDVRLWLEARSQNHGWVLVGDESEASTVARYDSREHPEPSRRPTLSVRYSL